MAESELRKRNTPSKPKADVQKNSGRDQQDHPKHGGILRFSAVLIGLSTLAVLLYTNPSFVTESLRDFLGFEEGQALAGQNSALESRIADVEKRDAVVAAFKHAWLAYERDAMGADEYHPISHQGTNLTEAGGIGYTVVDSIDTMLLMGLNDEYVRARHWVETKMDLDRNGNFNTFETTIRVLGGLLSAYHFSSQDPLFLEKARELADRMMPVFDTPSGLPLSMVNLAQRKGIASPHDNGMVSTAEVATLQLEFRYLGYLTEEDSYWDAAEKVMKVIKASAPNAGLASIFMNPNDGRFVLSAIRLGSRGDSYYEYLLKQYLQTNLTEPVYKEMYAEAMDGIHEHLIKKGHYTGITYTSEIIPEHNAQGEITWRLTPKQDHLVCFLGGSLMLGAATTGANQLPVSVPPKPKQLTPQGKRDWKTGVELIETCMLTHDTATGLSPEIAHFRIASDRKVLMGSAPSDWYIKGGSVGAPPPYDARYILRPETVESLFIAHRLTGDVKYRQYGWKIFQSIEKYCKISTGGYASILNVDQVPVEHEDKMETFLMSETLKYLFLLFSDDTVLPLNKYVFNTEAHPLPVIQPTRRATF